MTKQTATAMPLDYDETLLNDKEHHFILDDLDPDMEPEFYPNPTPEEKLAAFHAHTKTCTRLLDAGSLTISELREVSEHQLLELFIWFLDLRTEKRDAYTKQLREALSRVDEARKKTREIAQRMLAKRGVVVVCDGR